MKKILILTTYNPLEGSGIEKVMNEVGKTLGNSGEYKVIYLFSGNGKIKENSGITYKSIKVPKTKGINYIFYCLKLPKYIKKENPNLIIDNMGSSFFYLLFTRKIKCKIVSVCHGTPWDFKKLAKFFHFDNLIQRIKYYLYSSYNYLTSSYCIKKSDLIITLSNDLKTQLVNKLKNNNIEVIYNGYDPVKNIDPKKHKGLNILFVSNDHIRKGIDILENIAKYYTNNSQIKFYIIGKEYNSKQKNIISLGRMDRMKLYKFMSTSDIIFLPSYCEGQPLVILEAMGLGCIPVISKECHMDMLYGTVFEQHINLNNNLQGYIDIFNSIITNNNLIELKKLSKNIITKYSWENQTKLYVDALEKIL